jgi:hypothetical protein
MENALGILTGITIVAVIISVLDWLGQRKERATKNRAR